MEPTDEVPLLGGAVNGDLVVRVGAEVRRPPQRSGPAVRSLLAHLDSDHFEAPVHLGVDDEGRDRFTFIPGDVGVPPFPAWVLSDTALASAARLLRRQHTATSTMPVDRGLPWDTASGSPVGRIIGHNDACPENTVFRDGEAVAFIDFDRAGPTEPVLDLAHLLRMWVPLGVGDGTDRPARLAARMRAALVGYGSGSGAELQQALRTSVEQAERFVGERLDRADLTAGYFARRRTALLEAAAAV